MKRFTYILVALAGIFCALPSCVNEDFELPSDVPEGYERITFTTDVPVFAEVATKAVDPDGGGIQNMVLFCFDVYGLFISTAEAEVNRTPDGPEVVLEGSFSATVPKSTACIHFIGNQNYESIKAHKEDFYNKTEAQSLEVLEASSGRMVYWGHKDFDMESGETLQEQLVGETIMLVRNHAMIRVNDKDLNDASKANPYMTVHGMTVYNSYAFGTVCPWHPRLRFDFDWDTVEDFVTIPVNKAKTSNIDHTTSDLSRYVYEHDNTMEDPISVIIQATPVGETTPLYYRVMLVDSEGEQIMVRRNHEYIINIAGKLSYGQSTFADAVTAPASNNIWVSISDEIKKVQDSNYALEVFETSYILDESHTISGQNTFEIKYTLTPLAGTEPLVGDTDTEPSPDRPSVDWIDGNEVAMQSFNHVFKVDGNGVGQGSVTVVLNQIPEEDYSLEGTLLIKKGRLFRRVKMITIKTQKLVPAWVSSEVYGGLRDDNGVLSEYNANVTVMFTIPETTPKELFPFDVLISCNKLDARYIPGNDSEYNSYDAYAPPIIRKGQEGWFGEDYFGYKYVHTVTEPGFQRLYFKNVLYEDSDVEKKMYIEAMFFETVEKKIHFIDNKLSIWYDESTLNFLDPGNVAGEATDEKIYYVLVPQKKNALVEFGIQLYNNNNNNNSQDKRNADPKDEFLLYSQYLIPDNAEMASSTAICEYREVPEVIWEESVNGRMFGFRPRNVEVPTYSLKLRTTEARSEEPVRISSVPLIKASEGQDNNPIPDGYSSFSGRSIFRPTTASLNALTPTTDFTALDESLYPWYDGNSYRSNTFELSNYNPFRFAARVVFDPSGNNEVLAGYGTSTDMVNGAYFPEDRDYESDEMVSMVTWPYIPSEQVNIQIDITSFGGSDYKSVDPFGTEFEVYIDAPMLEIDTDRLEACRLTPDKLRAEEVDGKPTGRFIYTVDADRDVERRFGTAQAARKDLSPGTLKEYIAGNQASERKTLPFKVNGIVSAGDIVISSDESTVVFHKKSFTVNNAPQSLTLTYGADRTNVPVDAFVPFELASNHNRIGVITMNADGACSLRLRSEYEYAWVNDPVIIRYQAKDNTVYVKQIADLATLFANPVINLDLQDQ